MPQLRSGHSPRTASTRSRKTSNTQRSPGNRSSERILPRGRVAAAVEALAAPRGTARFAAGKALTLTAERDPERVYPHFEAIAAVLGSESKIVRWNALRILARLAPVDHEHHLDRHLDAYLGFIDGGNLISAANAIQGAGLIARSRPDLLARIVDSLLGVERAAYETDECRNVATQAVLAALERIGPTACGRPEVRAFMVRQQTNPRAKVARDAQRMLREQDQPDDSDRRRSR